MDGYKWELDAVIKDHEEMVLMAEKFRLLTAVERKEKFSGHLTDRFRCWSVLYSWEKFYVIKSFVIDVMYQYE